MTDLLIARMMFTAALIFHIAFVVMGIGLPLMMTIAEGLWLKTRDKVWLELAKRWAKTAGVLFAIGAITGTLVSIQLGLLWPVFMREAMPVIGLPFAIEGFAFFLEAIFIGIYLYGWDRVSEKVHFFSGIIVALASAASGFLILTVNAWMNAPQGFTVDPVTGAFIDIDPIAAMFNPATPHTVLHTLIAMYLACAFVLLGIHAWGMLRGRRRDLHRRALKIALVVGLVGSILIAGSGHFSASQVAEDQPVKFAAMEAQWEDEACAPLTLGGIPDEDAEKTDYAIEIPCALSILAANDPDYEVKGLSGVNESDRPPVAIVHWSFDIMVGLGMLMMLVSGLGIFLWWRAKKLPENRFLLWGLVVSAPAGVLALELGWIVTEVGRQPWVIKDIMRTEDAVTPVTGLVWPFLLFLGIFLLLGAVVLIMIRKLMLDPDLEETSTDPGSDETSVETDQETAITDSDVQEDQS